MPRDGSGIYTRPPGTNAVADTTIESTKYNANVADVETDLNAPRPIVAGGTGANNAVDAANNLGVVTSKGAQTFTEAEKAVARSNIAAAPFDALAYNGMQINGSMEVSQELGTAGIVIPNGSIKYAIDGWRCYANNAATRVINVQQTGGPLSAGFQNCLKIAATTGGSYAAANDLVYLYQSIEGYRTARLGWGTASAQPITIGFYVFATIAGTLAVSVQNNGSSRSYVANVVINAAGTWEYKTVTIPGDTVSTWLTTNGPGINLGFGLSSSGSGWSPPNTWVSANATITASTTNFMATSGNVVMITGVAILPGTQAPTAAQSPLIMRPFDQELVTCRRYFQPMPFNGPMETTGAANVSFNIHYAMRAGPTILPTVSTLGIYANGADRFQSAPNCVAVGSPTPITATISCGNFSGLLASGPAIRSGDLSFVIANLDARL
jgi:hypothetical protein